MRLLLLSASLLACKKHDEPTAAPAPAASSIYLYAEVATSDGPAPARFGAALPSTAAEVERSDALPPEGYLRAKLATGDRATEERLLAAMRKAVANGAMPEPVAQYYRRLFDYNASPESCEVMARIVQNEAAAAKQAVYLPFARCSDPKYEAAFDRDEAPSAAVLERVFERGIEAPTAPGMLTARLAAAAREVATHGERYDVRKVGIVLAGLEDPKAIALAVELHRGIDDPARRAWLGVGLGRRKGHAEAAKIFAAACKSLEMSSDPLCTAGDEVLPAQDGGEPTPAIDAALESKLRAHGLIRKAQVHGATVEEILIAGGRATRFDTETGQFPNEHDVLLAELAALAAPALDDVIFEEHPPPESEMDTGSYGLVAYSRGKRIETRAENLGDWYDLGAVVGLLNAVARDRGIADRFVVLPTGDQTATVLAGPEKGIEAARAEGLITIASAGAAMDTGKAFEQRVFEAIQRGELELK